MGAGMCTGHPTCPGVCWVPKRRAPALAIRGRAGDPILQMRGEQSKGPPVAPTGDQTNTSFPILGCAYLSP